jgi:hypothetical protein
VPAVTQSTRALQKVLENCICITRARGRVSHKDLRLSNLYLSKVMRGKRHPADQHAQQSEIYTVLQNSCARTETKTKRYRPRKRDRESW